MLFNVFYLNNECLSVVRRFLQILGNTRSGSSEFFRRTPSTSFRLETHKVNITPTPWSFQQGWVQYMESRYTEWPVSKLPVGRRSSSSLFRVKQSLSRRDRVLQCKRPTLFLFWVCQSPSKTDLESYLHQGRVRCQKGSWCTSFHPRLTQSGFGRSLDRTSNSKAIWLQVVSSVQYWYLHPFVLTCRLCTNRSRIWTPRLFSPRRLTSRLYSPWRLLVYQKWFSDMDHQSIPIKRPVSFY